jgi:2'-hydroxyisoflavone reductase
MPTDRRQFIAASSTLLAAAAVMPAWGFFSQRKPMRILYLGGTGFLGPHMVRDAIAAGHTVTLFNRGRSNPHLFPDVEKREGDRYGDLSSLEAGEWDAVIDTFTYTPDVVGRTAELLKDRVGQYLVVSTVSVYRDYATPGQDEDAPLAEIPDETADAIKTHREVGQHYGAMKARCEQRVSAIMPGRTCIVRPGLIVGRGDETDRFTYWPTRVARGGEVLAPASPDHFTQSIDVRDLAVFINLCAQRQTMGTFNADSPASTRTMGQLLDTCKSVSGSDATFTWASAEFLAASGVGAWQHMTCWVPPEGTYAGFGQVSCARATAAGLTIRPLADTVKDTLAWVNEVPEREEDKPIAEARRTRLATAPRAGLSPEREAEVLKAWHTREG